MNNPLVPPLHVPPPIGEPANRSINKNAGSSLHTNTAVLIPASGAVFCKMVTVL